MSDKVMGLSHLDLLRAEPGPTISGRVASKDSQKITLVTKFGIYEIRAEDIQSSTSSDDGATTSVTVLRGAKLVFSRLIDSDSLMRRSRANLASVAQGANQLHATLHRMLGKKSGPTTDPSSNTTDCPMCDCTDCCECPVVDCGEDTSHDSRGGKLSQYYDDKIERSAGDDYRKTRT